MKHLFFIILLLFSTAAMANEVRDTTPVNTLKTWFSRGKKPTEAQFHAWLDSYRHLSNSLDTNDVAGLVNRLAALQALAESGGDPTQGQNTAFSVVGSNLRLVDDGGTIDVPLANIGLQSEVDGSITNELQTIDVSSLSGSTLQLSLSSDGEATKEIDLSGLVPSIQAIKTPNDFDSFNIKTNIGNKGTTIEAIAAKVNESNQSVAKVTEQNSFQKTVLQPTGNLNITNKRIPWNVRDKNKATITLTTDARLLPPTSLEAGGDYSLTIVQDGTGHRLTYDGSVYHLNDTISIQPYSTTTILFSSPDGRNMYGNVMTEIPTDIDVVLSDFQNEIEIALIPSILVGNWGEGLNQLPKYTIVNDLGVSFPVTKDRSKNSFDVYHSTAPPNSSHLWEIEREDGKVAYNTIGSSAWTMRLTRYLTTFHSGNFHFEVWLKLAANGTTLPILAVANGSASDNGMRIRKNSSNQIQVTIGDGDGGYAFDFTTTTTLTVSDGWQRLQVIGDTVGADSIKIVLKGVTEGDAFTPVSITQMTNDLRPFYDNGGTPWNGWASNMFLFNRQLTTDEIATIGAIEQNKIYHSQPAELVGKSFSPQNVRGLEWSHDWSAIGGRLWQDDAKTTAVASNNDPVFRSESVLGNLKSKEFTAGATGTRPVWQSNVVNSLGALYFDSLDVFDIDGFSALKQLSGDFTIIGACRPDTITERTILSDNLGQYVSVSAPQTVSGGGGRIHYDQIHLRMKGSNYTDYHSDYGGLTARIPRDDADWFVFALTKQDTTFTLNVNNIYQSTATKGDAEDVSFYHIGGSGPQAFKGWFAEIHKYGTALSNRVCDSLVYTIANKYAITANTKTDETFDEERIEIWASDDPEIDYISFGEPYVLPAATSSQRDTAFWIGTVDASHNGQVEPADATNLSGVYLVRFDENGLQDTMRLFADVPGDTLDARAGYGAPWGRDSFLVVLTQAKYQTGQTNPNLGFTEWRPKYRWVNWRTKTLGALQTLNHPTFSSTDRYLPAGVHIVSTDTFYVSGYAAGFTNYKASFIKTVNGGTSFTNVFTIDPALSQFQYIGIDGSTYTPTGSLIDPEECKIIQMANGSYCYTIRIDGDDGATAEDDRGFYTYISSDIDDWSGATLTHGFVNGLSMPNIFNDNGYLYTSQREDFREYKTYLWRSIDLGTTWTRLVQVDWERADAFGVEDMYGGYINMNGKGYVVKSSADRTFSGDNCDLSMFPVKGVR